MKTATAAVLAFLASVDMEAWRKNLPVTGDREIDTPKILESLRGYANSGIKDLLGALIDPETDQEHCSLFTYDLVTASLDSVDWNRVLHLWDPALALDDTVRLRVDCQRVLNGKPGPWLPAGRKGTVIALSENLVRYRPLDIGEHTTDEQIDRVSPWVEAHQLEKI